MNYFTKSFKIDLILFGLSDTSLIYEGSHYKPLYIDSKSLSDT